MGRFRIFLIGSPQPVEVDLPAHSVADLSDIASRVRFLEGHLAEPASGGHIALGSAGSILSAIRRNRLAGVGASAIPRWRE